MPGEITPPTKVFVGRLNADVKTIDLRKLFESFGEVTECDILGTYGFVHMKTADQADEAIQKLNGHELHGSRISVEHSTGVKGRGSRGRGGGGGGMRGMRGGIMTMGGGGAGLGGGVGASGGYRTSRPQIPVSDRFSPYGRPPAVAYPSMMDRAGYTAYSADYGLDRRALSMRAAEVASPYYDDYDRRDPYAARAVALPRSSYDTAAVAAAAAAAAAYDRRPPLRDPYALPTVGTAGLYDRRDDYADSYARRSPPRYQTDALPVMSARAGAYDMYDRYAARVASPPRRFAPPHRELTAVRRY